MKPRGLSLFDRVRVVLGALGPLYPSRGAWAALALAGLLALLGSIYLATQHTVLLELDGTAIPHRTHARNPREVLREMGITLLPEDRMEAPPEEELRRGAPLRVTLARRVVLVHDGSVSEVRTHATQVAGAIAEMGAVVLPHDILYLGADACALDTALPPPPLPVRAGVQAYIRAVRRPLRLSVRRAISLTVQDGPIPIAFYTTARTVGEALLERGLVIYLGDRIWPDPGSAVSPGLVVNIERAKPVVLDVGGARRQLRTRVKTVTELLGAENVSLGPKDYVLPDPRTAVARDLRVAVVRVRDAYVISDTPIPFITRWEANPALEIDLHRVANPGAEGSRQRRERIHYENERETFRTEEEEWVARGPQDRVLHYGTRIVLRSVSTPTGEVVYWRKLNMYATAYNAPTAGVSRSSPYYGLTRSGLRARKGLVAVDPYVISLGTQVYVPGYGVALAADTGGGIRGQSIDLCYDDDNLEAWHQRVDVYILTPVPAASAITWILDGLALQP